MGREQFLSNLAAELNLDFLLIQETYVNNTRKFINLLVLEKLEIVELRKVLTAQELLIAEEFAY